MESTHFNTFKLLSFTLYENRLTFGENEKEGWTLCSKTANREDNLCWNRTATATLWQHIKWELLCRVKKMFHNGFSLSCALKLPMLFSITALLASWSQIIPLQEMTVSDSFPQESPFPAGTGHSQGKAVQWAGLQDMLAWWATPPSFLPSPHSHRQLSKARTFHSSDPADAPVTNGSCPSHHMWEKTKP